MLESDHLHDSLDTLLIPAVPVTFDSAGRIDVPAQEHYAAWMAAQPIGGVAVWAHTGRGLRLAADGRRLVLQCWRKAVPAPRRLIAAAGATPELVDFGQVILAARTMARQACDLGADALLVHPPTAFRDRAERDELVVAYHAAIAEVGLPLVLFYLYPEAGGIAYSRQVLRTLLSRPDVLGIKVATLERIITFQDLARLLEMAAPGKLLITGEDRFLGYSLMSGTRPRWWAWVLRAPSSRRSCWTATFAIGPKTF